MTRHAAPHRDIARPALRAARLRAGRVGALLVVALTATAAPAAGGTPAVATGNPADCSSLEDAVARLACFDRHFPHPAGVRDVAPATTAPATDEHDAAAREALFGLDDTVRRNRGERRSRPEAPQRIESAVSRLDLIEPGRHRITLANGQVWEQTEVGAGFLPRVGETVSVRQAALNSFLMRGRTGGAVRARRLR